MKTNLWIINHHATGQGRHQDFAVELSKLGYEVTIIASSFEHNSFKETKVYSKGETYIVEKEKEFNRVFIKTPPYKGNGVKRLYNQIIFSLRVVKFGLRVQSQLPDIIIGSSVHLFAGIAALMIARKRKIPFIFEVRDLWPQTLIDLGAIKPYGPTALIFKFIEKYLYKKADKIVSVLPDGVKYISSLGIGNEKVEYVPNGVNLGWFDSCLKDVYDFKGKAYFNDNSRFIVTFAGSHGLANGLDTLIKAAHILRERNCSDISIVLVGDGPEKSSLVEMANSLELDNVFFIDKVPKDNIPWIISNSQACIFHLKKTPVFKYGISSNKLFDYLASKRPLISAVDASNDFALEANCGLSIPPESPEQLAEAIITMKGMSAAERNKLGENGRRYVESQHDFPILAKKLSGIIQSVLKYG